MGLAGGLLSGQDPGPSKLHANNLLREVEYPDSESADDVVRYAYNAQGEQVWTMDQEGNEIESVYDVGGRLTDRKATLDPSTTVDDAVLMISTGYNSRGLVETVTQYDATSGGTVKDQVKHVYDDWGNIGKISQDWNSTVTGSGDELEVVFNPNAALTGGGIRAIRRTGVHLPDGTTVSYTFGSTGGRHDAEVSRVTNVMVGMTVVASYEYLGLAQVAGTELPEPELLYNRFAPGAASGAYARLDRFDRVTSDIWTRGIDTDSNGSYDVYRDFYEQTIGWSETSNIDQVEDEVYPNWDVAYTNDGLERLTRALRSDAINGNVFDEQWTLSQTGNWEHYILDLNGDGTLNIGAGDLDDNQTFNTVNELTDRDIDDDETDDFVDLGYDPMGNLTDDKEDYRYVYDVWGRLRKVKDQSDNLVAEYTYNGLGHRIGWHYDVTDDGTTGQPDLVVDADDPWFHFVYDDRWRIVATYRADHSGSWTIDGDPKERFVYHNAGLEGYGSSSYIDAVVLRERDADNTGGWAGSPDGTLEERTYYVQNWRADVVALMTDAGQIIQQVRYDPYGVPFGLAKADVNGDGSVNTTDVTAFGNIWNGGNGTHPYADWNFDGAVNTSDYIGFLNSRANDTTLGRGKLGYLFGHVGGNNRKGYAGYEEATEFECLKPGTYYARHRAYIAELGRWNRRDPLGYVDGPSLYPFGWIAPLLGTDPMGLAYDSGAGGSCGGGCSGGGGPPGDDLVDPPPASEKPFWDSEDWECFDACSKCLKALVGPDPMGEGMPILCRLPDPSLKTVCLMWLILEITEKLATLVECAECLDCLLDLPDFDPFRELPQPWPVRPADPPHWDRERQLECWNPMTFTPWCFIDPGKRFLTNCELHCWDDWLEDTAPCSGLWQSTYNKCADGFKYRIPPARPSEIAFVCRDKANNADRDCRAKAKAKWFGCMDRCYQ